MAFLGLEYELPACQYSTPTEQYTAHLRRTLRGSPLFFATSSPGDMQQAERNYYLRRYHESGPVEPCRILQVAKTDFQPSQCQRSDAIRLPPLAELLERVPTLPPIAYSRMQAVHFPCTEFRLQEREFFSRSGPQTSGRSAHSGLTAVHDTSAQADNNSESEDGFAMSSFQSNEEMDVSRCNDEGNAEFAEIGQDVKRSDRASNAIVKEPGRSSFRSWVPSDSGCNATNIQADPFVIVTTEEAICPSRVYQRRFCRTRTRDRASGLKYVHTTVYDAQRGILKEIIGRKASRNLLGLFFCTTYCRPTCCFPIPHPCSPSTLADIVRVRTAPCTLRKSHGHHSSYPPGPSYTIDTCYFHTRTQALLDPHITPMDRILIEALDAKVREVAAAANSRAANGS